MKSVLVLGIGNILLRDEGVGIHAIERLKQRYRFPEGVHVVDGGTLGLDLITLLEGVTHLLITDAVEAGRPPGSLIRLTKEELPTLLSPKISLHQAGLSDILSVARLCGTLPEEILFLGIQPASLEAGLELSPVVEAQLETLIAEIVHSLNTWGISPRKRD